MSTTPSAAGKPSSAPNVVVDPPPSTGDAASSRSLGGGRRRAVSHGPNAAGMEEGRSNRRLTVLDVDDADGAGNPKATRATLMASSAAPAHAMLSDDADPMNTRGSAAVLAAPSEASAAASTAASHLRAAGVREATERLAAATRGSTVGSVAPSPPGPTAAVGAATPPPSGEATAATVPRHQSNVSLGDAAPQESGGQESVADTAAEMQAAANRKWRSRRKHVFILSSAGRPIFTRWGNEYDFAELFGLLQTLVSLVNTGKENLQRVNMGTHSMHFHASGELTLVMVCATGESPRACQDQLKMLELQLLAVLPNANAILEKHPGFDVRSMFAAGDLRVMAKLIHRMNNDPGFLLTAVHTLPLPVAQREAALRILVDFYQGDGEPERDDGDDGSGSGTSGGGAGDDEGTGEHLYSLILAAGKVAAFVQPDDYPLPTRDMLLLINFAYSVLTTRGEVWAPICLPGVNDTGYLWCYVSILKGDVLLVHVATSQMKFPELSVASSHITEALSVQGLIGAFDTAAKQPWPELPGTLTRCGLQHLTVVKNDKLSISTLPPHISTKQQRKAFLRKLVALRDEATGVSNGATPFLVVSDATETVLAELSGAVSAEGARTHATQVYAVFSPMLPRSEIQAALTHVYKHVAATESIYLWNKRVTWEGL